MLCFKLWLESSRTDAYNKYWAPHFAALSAERPDRFSHLFPQGQDRIYLPVRIPMTGFSSDIAQQSEQTKAEVAKLFAQHQYRIVNWGLGIAINPQGQRVTIKDALDKIGDEDMSRSYFGWINSTYGGMRINRKQNDFLIVISRDIHDIARMSTARSWGSCISLPLHANKFRQGERGTEVSDIEKPEGSEEYVTKWTPPQEYSTFKKLRDEIMSGGLVAYLTTPDDRALEHPLARIHITRYEDEATGKSLLICKDDSMLIYGKTGMTFFIQAVRDWLEKQGESESALSGYYTRQASKWTEGTPYEYFDLKNPQERDAKRAIVYYLKKNTSHGNYVAAKYVHALLRSQLNQWTASDGFWKFLKDVILGEKLTDTPIHLMRELWRRYPEKISHEDISKLDSPSDFFGRSSFGGYGDGYKEYREWAEQRMKELSQSPINAKDADTMLRLFKQMRFHTFPEGLLDTVFAWGYKLVASKLREEVGRFISILLSLRNNHQVFNKYYPQINHILEKGADLLPDLDLWELRFYLKDLNEKGYPLPKLDLDNRMKDAV